MRYLLCALLIAAPLARAEDPSSALDRICDNAAKKRALQEGVRQLKSYYEFSEKAAQSIRYRDKADEAMKNVVDWLARTPQTLGRDLQANSAALMEFFDLGRVDLLKAGRAGHISYASTKIPGMQNELEYAYLLPSRYNSSYKDTRYPLVVALHGRALNVKHPAFRGHKAYEYGRIVLYDHWRDTPSADAAIFLAPRGLPTGFQFGQKRYYDELHILMRTIVEGIKNYRVDWNRLFVDVQGSAIRVILENDPFLFAGFFVHDREDDRDGPVLPKDEWYLLENLNGVPLCYVADEAHWDKVGKPFADELTKRYAAWGVPNNLLILKGKRDANGGLRGDPNKIHDFLVSHHREVGRKSFTWRFHDGFTYNPLPIELLTANTTYADGVPLAKTAGRIVFHASRATAKDAKGKDQPYNLVKIDVTEVESLRLLLSDSYLDMDLPLTVVINGKTVADKVPMKRDIHFFIKNILPGFAFEMPYLGLMDFTFKDVFKPQYVPEQKSGENAGKASGGASGAKNGSKKPDSAAAEDKAGASSSGK